VDPIEEITFRRLTGAEKHSFVLDEQDNRHSVRDPAARHSLENRDLTLKPVRI